MADLTGMRTHIRRDQNEQVFALMVVFETWWEMSSAEKAANPVALIHPLAYAITDPLT